MDKMLCMNYVDFHTHLDCYKNKNELYNQLQSYKGTIVTASVNYESYLQNMEIARKAVELNTELKIIPTIGIHPKYAATAPDNLSIYDDLCAQSPLIGEIGMDFCWYKDASPQKQEKVLRYFLNHCNKTKKYCVIHTKDAERQIADILEEYPDAKIIIHWYDGPEDIFQEFIKRGYYQTFGCQTIRSPYLQKLLRQMPLNLLLAETDNPDSEPWLGGNDNSVHLIRRIYINIAQVLGLTLEEAAEILNKNAACVLQAAVKKLLL